MSKIKAILKGLLATAYQQADGEISELIEKPEEEISESDILSAIKNLDKQRVLELKKAGYQDGYKKAKREVSTDFEKRLKEKFSVDSEMEGDDLINQIFEVTSSSQKTTGKTKELTDDDVKKHPVFIQMENQFKKQLYDTKNEYEDKISTKDKEYQKKEIFGTVSKEALKIFESLNPILSSDPEIASNQKSDFLDKLKGYDFETVEGKIIISKDGNLLEDEHGHKVDFSKFVKSTACKYYDFKVAEERTAAGADKNSTDQKQKSTYNGTLPKTREEFEKMINDKSISLTDRIAIRDNTPAELQTS